MHGESLSVSDESETEAAGSKAAAVDAAEKVTSQESAETVAINIWGPPEKRGPRPVGMGDVILGFVYSQLFAAVPILALFFAIAGNLDPNASAQESSTALNAVLQSGPVIVLTMLLSWLGWMTAVWWAATRKGDRDWKALLKWRFVPQRDIPIGIAVALTFRIYEVGVSQLLKALGVNPEALSNTSTITSQTGVWLVLLALGAALGAPLVEEIFFRGLFLSVAVRNYGKVAAIAITSIVFGFMHVQPTAAGTAIIVTQTALIGVVLAVLVLKTQRLWTAICAHLAINISGVVLALVFLG
jgi:membrane protease YdiL (CAAX protease family)